MNFTDIAKIEKAHKLLQHYLEMNAIDNNTSRNYILAVYSLLTEVLHEDTVNELCNREITHCIGREALSNSEFLGLWRQEKGSYLLYGKAIEKAHNIPPRTEKKTTNLEY